MAHFGPRFFSKIHIYFFFKSYFWWLIKVRNMDLKSDILIKTLCYKVLSLRNLMLPMLPHIDCLSLMPIDGIVFIKKYFLHWPFFIYKESLGWAIIWFAWFFNTNLYFSVLCILYTLSSECRQDPIQSVWHWSVQAHCQCMSLSQLSCIPTHTIPNAILDILSVTMTFWSTFIIFHF